mmetsp:Transcript_22850/g.60360  ORF Transcript_22850/g.60360 Transcript_22850/m.60360 type:complete len:339 (+) Transcript_22850:59-1075(+)
MVVIAITGGASGIGYEAARQLSSVPEVTKIVITARSAQKADGAISKLVKETGKDKSFYDSVIVELGDLTSIKAAVASFPAFDRLCLNAGGIGTGKMHASGNGITDTMVINTMGHAALVDGLLAVGKIPAGSRVVYVGSEAARGLWGYCPMLPNNYCGTFKEKDMDWAIGKDFDGCCSCVPIVRQMGDYRNAKIMGHLHFVNLAKEHPESHWITVSPGSVGGSVGEGAHFPMRQTTAYCPCILRCAGMAPACSAASSVKIGTKRYVDVLTGDFGKYPTGSMPMSGTTCCRFWGACGGPMVDNRPLVMYFKDEALCEKATAKVREWNKKWESQAPGQVTM